MKCDKVIQLLSLYLDGELTDQQEEIEKHLKTCESCNNEYNKLRKITMLINSFDEPLPPWFTTTLHNKLVNLQNREFIVTQFILTRVIPAFSAAIILIIVIISFFYNPQQGRMIAGIKVQSPQQVSSQPQRQTQVVEIEKDKKIVSPLRAEVKKQEVRREKVVIESEKQVVTIGKGQGIRGKGKAEKEKQKDKEGILVKQPELVPHPSSLTPYKEAVVKIDIVSKEDKVVEVEVNLHQGINFLDSDSKNETYCEVTLRKDIPTTLLFPVLIREDATLDAIIRTINEELKFTFNLFYPQEQEDAQKLLGDLPEEASTVVTPEEENIKNLGHYLVFLPFKNQAPIGMKKDDETTVNIALGRLTFIPITLEHTFYIPNLVGETFLVFANDITNITNFQILTNF